MTSEFVSTFHLLRSNYNMHDSLIAPSLKI